MEGQSGGSPQTADQITNAGFDYDDNGNQTAEPGASYEYDSQNRMSGATKGGVAYSFSYDGDGNRASQAQDGSAIEYIVDRMGGLAQVVAEVTLDNSIEVFYVRGAIRGLITEPGASFFVGASRGGAFSSDGVIDELYVYGRALSVGEIGILTGKPELVKPRIHAVEPLQRLFFLSERVIGFRCELCGRIEPARHRLRAELLGQPEGEPIAAMAAEVTGATHVLEATVPREGFCTLRVALTDEAGTVLDEKTAQLRFIDGPFAGGTALAE